MQLSGLQNGKFNNIDMHNAHGQKHQTSSPWMPSNHNMQRGQILGQGGLNNHMASMVGHGTANTDLMGNTYQGMGGINLKTGEYLQHSNLAGNLDINGIN